MRIEVDMELQGGIKVANFIIGLFVGMFITCIGIAKGIEIVLDAEERE
jgi:hypothetical protein